MVKHRHFVIDADSHRVERLRGCCSRVGNQFAVEIAQELGLEGFFFGFLGEGAGSLCDEVGHFPALAAGGLDGGRLRHESADSTKLVCGYGFGEEELGQAQNGAGCRGQDPWRLGLVDLAFVGVAFLLPVGGLAGLDGVKGAFVGDLFISADYLRLHSRGCR